MVEGFLLCIRCTRSETGLYRYRCLSIACGECPLGELSQLCLEDRSYISSPSDRRFYTE